MTTLTFRFREPAGPLLEVTIAPPPQWMAARLGGDPLDAGGATPAVRGWALIDTGATMSCVTRSTVGRLNAPRGPAIALTGVLGAWAARDVRTTPTCYVGLLFHGEALPHELPAPVIADLGDVDGKTIVALIGRDILRRYDMRYRGPEAIVELTRRP
jgi:hypothetical protein